MSRRLSIIAGALIVTTLIAQTPAPEARPTPRERQFKETVYFPPAAHPEWPLAPGDQAYAAINGDHLMGYVKELIGIAERYRDQGHQYWGRITGTSADAETAKWVMDKLRAVGVTDVHREDLDLPPQWMPASWEVIASGNGRTINLDTAQPMVRTPGTPTGESIDLEAAYVGLGTEADFMGRNVNGKAVFIEAVGLAGRLATERIGLRRTSQSVSAWRQSHIPRGRTSGKFPH